jgi:hypothetical protein
VIGVALGHHAGEQVVLAALASGGTTLVTGLVVFGQARLATILRWLRHR